VPKKHLRAPLILAAGLIAALSTQFAPAASTAAASSTAPAAVTTAAGGPKAPAETSALTQYADRVTTVGIMRFPGTFTSASVTDRTVTVYATTKDAALLRALRTLPAHGARLVVHTVPHSFRQLNRLAERIGRDRSALRSASVDVSSVAFDAPVGKLLVTLARPTGGVTAARTAALVGNARTRLADRYGSAWVSVANATEPLATTSATRDEDGSPWTPGDGIDLSGIDVFCSLGFTTKGNNSGNEFLLTAGHCGPGTVTDAANGSTIGNVSTQYLSNGAEDYDFDTIRANGRPRVWYGPDNTTDYYTVNGQLLPANGSAMTVDGDANAGQHTGNTVTNNEIYGYFNDDNYGQLYIGPLVEVSTGACIGGDSGGPAYVREGGTGDVDAVGTITGTNGSDCFVFWISTELSAGNVSLVTG